MPKDNQIMCFVDKQQINLGDQNSGYVVVRLWRAPCLGKSELKKLVRSRMDITAQLSLIVLLWPYGLWEDSGLREG